MSEWQVRVVRVGPIEKHPNADTLGITKVDEYPVIVKLGEFNEGDKAVYIPVDSVVPNTAAWDWLGSHRRIRARKLRGVFSMGLLANMARAEWGGGYICDKELGIVKYLTPDERAELLPKDGEPQPKTRMGRLMATVKRFLNTVLSKVIPQAPLSVRFCPEYTDLMSGRKIDPDRVFEGEEVVVTEKIHGTNFRAVYKKGLFGGKLMVGSHRTLKKLKRNVYWEMAKKYNLETSMKSMPNITLYGEIYGDKVQDLTYGCKYNERGLVIFDVYDNKKKAYLNTRLARAVAYHLGLDFVPILYAGEYSSRLKSLAEGTTTVGSNPHVREGVVIKSIEEKRHPMTGRMAMKLMGQGYLLRKDPGAQAGNWEANKEMFS